MGRASKGPTVVLGHLLPGLQLVAVLLVRLGDLVVGGQLLRALAFA